RIWRLHTAGSPPRGRDASHPNRERKRSEAGQGATRLPETGAIPDLPARSDWEGPGFFATQCRDVRLPPAFLSHEVRATREASVLRWLSPKCRFASRHEHNGRGSPQPQFPRHPGESRSPASPAAVRSSVSFTSWLGSDGSHRFWSLRAWANGE